MVSTPLTYSSIKMHKNAYKYGTLTKKIEFSRNWINNYVLFHPGRALSLKSQGAVYIRAKNNR